MGHDDRYTETYSSVPEGHQGPYVIPPLDELTRRGKNPLRPGRRAVRPTPPAAPAPPIVADARPRSANGSAGRTPAAASAPRGRRRLGRLVFVIVLLVVLIASGAAAALFGLVSSFVGSVGTESGWSSDARGEEPSSGDEAVIPSAGETTPSAVPTLAPAPPIDRFETVDQTTLDEIVDAPAAHVGEAIVAYAEVVVADTFENDLPPGTTAHLVSLSAQQPATSYEFYGGAESIVVDPGTEGVDAGDVLRVWLVVPDPESFASSSAMEGLGYPRLDIARAEIVGFYDLMQDVSVGEVRWDGEVPILPVTAHNASSEPMEFAIDLSAKLPDGSSAASTVAWTDVIPPGETVETEVSLYGTIPEGVGYHVEDVSRYPE